MRFSAGGPRIPDELLEERDRGNVVFFCGAGISVPAGLPDFPGLADQIMCVLGTPADANSRALFQEQGSRALDRVFNFLQEEYRRDELEGLVARILKTSRRQNLDAHSIILRLSRNAKRQPRVVTTNFDSLFELADRSLDVHTAETIHDFRNLGSLTGVVHLHGRCNAGARTSERASRLILSSSDLGWAYLADGWATRFVRALLDSHTVVFVGYKASDPPVTYLLEGLHSRGGPTGRMYAFDRGAEDEVRARWRSLGVEAIAYGSQSSDHRPLWESLGAWATRADDPDRWRRAIVHLAESPPRQLAAHERGQVVSLVRTSDGARAFATATPVPPAEWLCVLDRLARYARPNTSRDEPDPLTVFGLDDDPPHPATSEGAKDFAVADPLGRLAIDERTDSGTRLAGARRHACDPLPGRLASLAPCGFRKF